MTTHLITTLSSGHHDPWDPGGPTHARLVIAIIPCTYCLADVAGSSFRYLSSVRRLVHSQCPSCQRWMTLSVANWRHRTTSAPHRVDRPGTPAAVR